MLGYLALFRFLLMAAEVVERMMIEAAERENAGNLQAIQTAVSDFKSAKTKEQRSEAAAKIQSAFK